MKRFCASVILSAFIALIALAWLSGCGGDGIIYYPPVEYIGFVNYNVDLADAALNQAAPDCVYVSGTDEYFATWEDARDGIDYDIYTSFFDTLRADPASSEILVCTALGDQISPSVAYNSYNEDLLVVWEDYGAADADIWGQLVDAVSGALIGSNFPIRTAIGSDERDPQVVYNPVQNNYLVIWDEDTGTDRDIQGHIVEANGTIVIPTPFSVTPVTGDQQSAVAAYDTINDRYLVVFMDFAISPLESDLYGQFVAHDGGLVGPDFVISDDSQDQDFPAVAFNPDHARFLVVWEDNYLGDYDVTAQQVLSNGLLFGGPFVVSPDYSDQTNTAITYNGYFGEYVVLWEDTRLGGSDIYGQALSSGATFLGYNTIINDDPVTCAQPAICSRPAYGEYLATWSGLFSGNYDILGQILY